MESLLACFPNGLAKLSLRLCCRVEPLSLCSGWFTETQAGDTSFSQLLDVAVGILHDVNMLCVRTNGDSFTVGG